MTPEIGQTYHVVLTVKDNKFSVEFGGVQIFSDVEDTNTTQQYNSGLLGLIVHQSTVRFQNVFVTAASPIESVVTEIPDIYVVAGDGTTKDELLAQLPQQVNSKIGKQP